MTFKKPNPIRPRLTFCFIVTCSTICLLMFAAGAIGDIVDDSLPTDTPLAVKAGTRQVIQSGMAPQPLITLTQAMLQHRFDEMQIQRVHALLVDASASGTPEHQLMNKAFEGLAKNVPPSMIINAMETVQARNVFAYQHAAKFNGQPDKTRSLGQMLAASLAAGLSKKDANEIIVQLQRRENSQRSDMAYELALESFQTARNISRLGVSSQAVTGIITQALSKGYSHEDIQSLRNDFMTQAQNTEPQELAHAFASAMQAGKGPQEGAGSPGGSPGDSGQGGAGSGSGDSGSGSGGSGSDSGGSGGAGSGSGGNGGSGSGSGGSGGPGSVQ